jgi:hypothetical protein
MIKQSVDNIQPKKVYLTGIHRGVIEDNNDPEMLGRCKVRIWGIHDELIDENEAEGIPTEKLPWAEPCLGLVEGSVSGAGMFSIPLQGSHVFVFFEGGNWNAPRYFATAPGMPSEAPDTSKGFNDPSGQFPRDDRLNESDYHRLARGVTEETIVEAKTEQLDKGVTKADGGTWDEPDPAYAAQYPSNIVLATHRGITVEIDSTAGAERVHIFHPSNTYLEIDKDGNLVYRNEGDRFEITKGDRNKHVFGSDNETVDVDKTSKVGKDETIEIGDNRNETIGKNETRAVGQTLTESVGQDWTIDVSGNITITAGGNIVIKGARIDLN